MDPVAPEYNPHTIEAEVVTWWRARRLPAPGGTLGPPGGPVVRQFEGFWTSAEFPPLIAQRAVVADVDARSLALSGRRASGTLRQVLGSSTAVPSPIPALLNSLGVWTGGDGRTPWDSEDRSPKVQAMVGRLAAKEVLVTRDEAFRVCPTCGTLRSPERIVYDQQEGDTYLIRFPMRIKDLTVNALVWVDAPWKLLGASALLLNPNLRYVVAGYRRREDRELILISKASLERFRAWIPESSLEVVEEREGREFQGTPYVYPLRHEFPMGGELTAPAGTLLAAADVGDSGTGIVPLVPGHGPTDTHIADRLGVTGWPLLTPRGRLDFTLMHKYAGLDLETANEFVLRDLSEAGALLALLRVKRGVPYCAVCGSSLLWAPARAWCLEPSRLPPERRALFARLLPGDPLPGQAEVAPWPVSESTPSEDASAVSLLECPRCERLDALEGAKQCPCGGQRTVVRRRLLPSAGAALSAWARLDPFPEGDSVHLYVGQRRRVPAVVHHVMALTGIDGSVNDVTLTVVPTIATADMAELVRTFGADAVRASMVRSSLSEASGGRFASQCRREAERTRGWWSLSREVLSLCDPSMVAEFARPIGGALAELEVEDRAIVARWERTRVQALAHFDHSASGRVHRRVAHFLDNDLAEYRELVGPRLSLPGNPPTKRAALRTLVHLLRGISEVLAPIVPFTAESVHRSLSTERTSLFEQPMAGLDRTLLNDELVTSWDRWRTVLRAVRRARRTFGVPWTKELPGLVLTLSADDVADRLRAEKETLARLARVQKLEVGSPREPWSGRQRVLRPVDSEIQKVYPTQASQISHLLQRLAPRRGAAPTASEELNVVIDGYPVRIFPAMVSFVETLPENMVPVPWSQGEMYVELPTGAAGVRPTSPPLSSDAFWLVRRLERRLRASPAESSASRRVAIVTAKEPLFSELRSIAEPLGRFLGLAELRVIERSEEAMPPNAMTGRTRTGDRWWVHVPGLPGPRVRIKHPTSSSRICRVTVAPPPAPSNEVDYADEQLIAREEAVRALGRELDEIVGLPLLGPAKVSGAWELGLHSVDDLRRAPYATVAALPGFGGPVAEVVLARIGASAPTAGTQPRPPPSVPPAPPPTVSSSPPTPRADVPEPATGSPPSLDSQDDRLSAHDAEVISPAVPPGEVATPTPPASDAPETVPGELPPTEKTELEIPAEEKPSEPAEPELAPSEPLPAPPTPTETAEGSEEGVVPPSADVSEAPLLPPEEVPAAPPVEELPPEEAPEAPAPTPENLAEEETPPPEVALAPPPEIPASDLPPPEPAPEAETTPVSPTIQEPPPSTLPIEEAAPVIAPETAPSETLPPLEPVAEAPPVEVSPETVPLAEAPPEPPVPELPPEPGPSTEPPPDVPALEVSPGIPPPTEPPTGSPPLELPPEAPPLGDAPAEAPVAEPVTEAPATPAPEGTVSEDAGMPVPAPPIVEEVAPETPIPEVLSPEPVGPAEPPLTPKVEVVPEAPAEATPPPTPVPAPSSPPVEVGPPLPPSGVELAVEESFTNALGGFLDATAAGHRGVCLVRESPERIRARVGSRPIEVYWLTNVSRGPSVRPADLDAVWTLLGRKLLEDHATAFFLEGVEYLVRLHGADSVLSGLVQFDRLARENDARIWIFLTPGLMKPVDIERFRSTFGGTPPPA